MMPIVGTLDMLLTLIASAVLYRKMDEINDLFNMSKEIKTVGCFAILSLGELLSDVTVSDGSMYGKTFLRVGDCFAPRSWLLPYHRARSKLSH